MKRPAINKPSGVPRGHNSVMAQRVSPHDSLDFFPTPPWATRALCEHVIPLAGHLAWDPACGTGTMVGPLQEYALAVAASDVHDYGWDHAQHDFLQPFTPEGIATSEWIITNPPFRLAVEFAERALDLASHGVALLVRSVWAEGGDRYRRLFSKRPPAIIAQFSERVPMTKGRWNPDASTATSYAWFVWHRGHVNGTKFVWIPPGCRMRLTKPDDAPRYANLPVGVADPPAETGAAA